MGFQRFFVSLLVGSAIVWGARDTGTVDQAAARVELLASQARAAVRPEFRMLAAQALKDRYPELANKFVQAVLAEVRSKDAIDPQVLQSLAEIAPEETIALLPGLKTGSDRIVINALFKSNQSRRAVDLYRASLAKDQPRVDVAPGLFRALSTEDPGEAKKLFTEMLAAFSFDTARPHDLYTLINSAVAIAPIAPGLAADVCDRIVTIASASDYGKDARPAVSATFQVGEARIVTTNWRDTLLVAAGARLLAVAPERFAKRKEVFAKWNLAGPISMKGLSMGARPDVNAGSSPELMISERIGKIRSLSDDERPRAVLELAQAIHALPKGSKLGLANGLANLATEGDNGQEAMNAVAASLGEGIEENAPPASAYLELAKLIRYEHTRKPFSDPSLDAADAVLTLRERIHQESGFSLTSMDGKTYSLEALRGKIVLLNFWATWCPPCRKEMPDMEALYRRFRQKGLVVLAVSDEDRETVAGFLAKQNYTFPVLLDPGRKTTDAFSVEGIPKSFIFDAQGQLVAEAMDMRTERQFLDLLKEAGLQ
jgi:peroxiredoxin